jgi:transposase
MAIAVLGIDLGKNSCSVAGLDGTGRVVLRRRRRTGRASSASPERCRPASWRWRPAAGPTTLGRLLREKGHEGRLMSPEYVQPYVKAQKNDERDAEAIARLRPGRRCASSN